MRAGFAARLDRVRTDGEGLRGDAVRPIPLDERGDVEVRKPAGVRKFSSSIVARLADTCTDLAISSRQIGPRATLAPYASSYRPPRDVPRSDGPVQVTLALGHADRDEVVEGMEWEHVAPNAQDVLDAVRNLRDGDGLVGMEIDLPWDLGTAVGGREGTIVVVGS